jgi:hypothetical protein
MERMYEMAKADLGVVPQTLNNSNVTGRYYAAKEYRRALAVLQVGALAATKTAKIEVFEAKDAAGTSAQLLAGATATITANAAVTEMTIALATVLEPRIRNIALALSLLTIPGMVRLARFNASPEHEARDFTGLSSPVAAAATVLVAVTWDELRLPAGLALALIALFAFFMVSTVPYPKARRRARSAAIGLVVFSLGVVVALAVVPHEAEPILVGALAGTLVIVAFGPITWVRLRRRGRGPDPLAPPDAPEEGHP